MNTAIGHEKLQKAWDGCARLGLRPTSLRGNQFRSDCPVHGKDGGVERNTSWGIKGDTVVWFCHSQKCHEHSMREGYVAVGLGGRAEEVRYIADELMKVQRNSKPVEKEYAEIQQTIERRYNYYRKDGSIWTCVLRFKPRGGEKKMIRHGHPREEFGGNLAWGDPADWPTEGQPLYRWQEVDSADTIDIVEGEKAADYCANLGWAAITWMGGANSDGWDKADWTPISGKTVRIWTDADEVGRSAGKAIADLLAGSCTVHLLSLSEGDAIGGYVVEKGNGIDDVIAAVGKEVVESYFDDNSVEIEPSKGISVEKKSTETKPVKKPRKSSVPQLATEDAKESKIILGYSDAELALPKALELLGINMFFNVKGNFPAFTWKDRKDGEDIDVPTQLTKEWAGKIRNTIKRTFQLTKFQRGREYNPLMHVSLRAWDDARDALMMDNKRDPYLHEWEKVAGEKPWDGVPRVDNFLHQALGAVDSLEPLTESNSEVTCFLSWSLHAMPVEFARNPGSHMDIVPVLWGAKETGKSVYLKLLIPPSARVGGAVKWFNDSENWEIFKDSKTVYERFSKHAIVELAENVGVKKADAQMIKQRISSNSVTFRKAYGHDPVTVPRTWMVVVTSNTQYFIPNDGTQTARRWASCYVAKMKLPYKELLKLSNDTYQQRAAEVKHRLDEGESILPSRKVRDLITQYSPRHLYTNDYFKEMLEELMVKHRKPLTTGQIMNYVNFGRINPKTVGDDADRKIHHHVWQRDVLPIVKLSWVKLRISKWVNGKSVKGPPMWHSPICDCGNKQCLANPHRPLYKDVLERLKVPDAKSQQLDIDEDDIEDVPF